MFGRGKKRARLLSLTVIVDDNNLVRGVARLLRDAFEAAFEQLDAITNRDDDRNRLRLCQIALDPISMRPPVHRDMPAHLLALQVRFQRQAARFPRTRFSSDIVGSRSVAASP